MTYKIPRHADEMRIEPREQLFRLFEDRVYNSSFKDLSGWDRSIDVNLFPEISINLSSADLRRYIFECELPNESFEEVKRSIAALISARDRITVQPNNLLLTPGATAALAVILHFMRSIDIEVVLTDPPFYFSVQKLCQALGISFEVARRSVEDLDHHDCIFDLIKSHKGRRKAIILTHPRYVISRNYPAEVLSTIRGMLDSGDFLIIDQSVDMEFCNTDSLMHIYPSCIKIRTIGKSLGLNGSRLATLIADEDLVPRLNKQASILYGSLDAAMVSLGALISRSPQEYARHLAAVRKLVDISFIEARTIISDSKFELVKPENGFLGYILVDTSKIGRFTLYNELLRQSVHAMFSAHMGLKPIYQREMIRVNYLLDLRAGLSVLRKIAERPGSP